MPMLRTRSDRKRAFKNYDSPYRGLPSEVRQMIWRYYFIQEVSVCGPSLRINDANTRGYNLTQTPDATVHAICDRSESILALYLRYFPLIKDTVQAGAFPRPRLGLLLADKQVHHEAMLAMNGTLTLNFRVSEADQTRFEWFLSLIPQSLLQRIGTIRAYIDAKPVPRRDDIALGRWLRSALLLRVDTLHLHIHVHNDNGSYYTQLPDSIATTYRELFSKWLWPASTSGHVVSAIKKSDLGHLEINLSNAPGQVLTELSDATECIKWLGIDLLMRHGSVSANDFKILPINADRMMTITKA